MDERSTQQQMHKLSVAKNVQFRNPKNRWCNSPAFHLYLF